MTIVLEMEFDTSKPQNFFQLLDLTFCDDMVANKNEENSACSGRVLGKESISKIVQCALCTHSHL